MLTSAFGESAPGLAGSSSGKKMESKEEDQKVKYRKEVAIER
jgi:hypothetical protein